MRLHPLLLVALLAVPLSACIEEPPAQPRLADLPGDDAEQAEPVWADELVIEDRRYHPDDLLAGADREVRVVNRDDEAHTVTSFDGSFDVEVPAGGTATLRTPEPGAYLYSCRFHPEMGGEIDVL